MEGSSNNNATVVPNLSLPDDTIQQILAYFDVSTLIVKKQVCRNWKRLCENVIDAKQTTESRRTFQTNQELRDAVRKYTKIGTSLEEDPNAAEEFACTYGYPIGKWDVSNVDDFSCVFANVRNFNEDISEWDVSNATSMIRMFYDAAHFNRDLSSWDTSNVTRMDAMFSNATNFNGDISVWNTSKVTTMGFMFCGATSFNQNISAWDTSNVIVMVCMFYDAASFSREILSSWDTTKVEFCHHMFSKKKSPVGLIFKTLAFIAIAHILCRKYSNRTK